jgi:hypothetical protein
MMALTSQMTTIWVSVGALFLGLPAAIAAVVFNSNWVPSIILRTKIINIGLGKTTTLEFGLLTGPNDAVYAGAIMSMLSAVLLILGLIIIRHFTKHHGFGLLVLGPTLLNLLSQVGCCAAAYIFTNKYPVATSMNQIRYENGSYNTGGVLYTREGWACSMNKLYAEREDIWAAKACSRYVRSNSSILVAKLMME